MKVLLINSPIRLDAKPSCIPYGLCTIASTLRNAGHDIEIYDINALRPSDEAILSDLKDKQWDIVGVSGLVTTYKFQSWLIPHLREINPAGVIVQGGGLATSNPELCTADCVIQGEGEYSMLALCNGDYITGPYTIDINSIPMPAWDLLPIGVYLENPIWGNAAGNSSGFLPGVKVTRSMNIITSRGCPYSCNFCFHLFGQGNYRIRSPENVIAEIEILIDRYTVDFIGFVDDNTTASKTWIHRLCDLVIERKLPITWGCHSRASSITPKLADKLRAAGCVWCGMGLESAAQEILNAMNKKTCPQEASAAIYALRAAGIYPNTTFIFGYPGETPETVQKTIDFKRELGIECSSFFATPYPGTVLYEQVKDRLPKDYISRLGNATEFVVNLTEMNDELFFEMKKRMDAPAR